MLKQTRKLKGFTELFSHNSLSHVNSAFLSSFLALCVVFLIASGSRQETQFIFVRYALRKQKQDIFMAAVVRELINNELPFFIPDEQLRYLCANEGSRFREDLRKHIRKPIFVSSASEEKLKWMFCSG